MEGTEAALTTPVVRKEVENAKILFAARDSEGGKTGFFVHKEAADKLYTDLSAGLIRGNSVFPIEIHLTNEEGIREKRMVFINMINVENIIFEHKEEE